MSFTWAHDLLSPEMIKSALWNEKEVLNKLRIAILKTKPVKYKMQAVNSNLDMFSYGVSLSVLSTNAGKCGPE